MNIEIEDLNEIYGLRITDASMDGDEIILTFDNGQKVQIVDDLQICYERRFMTTDDDIRDLIGNRLVKIETKETEKDWGEFQVEETKFLEIATDGGFVTIVNHNIHNGYYGGFNVSVNRYGVSVS